VDAEVIGRIHLNLIVHMKNAVMFHELALQLTTCIQSVILICYFALCNTICSFIF